MKDLARRVWFVTFAALVIFVVYEIIKTLLFPHLSVINSHVITVIVVAVMTFFVSRYALKRYGQALSEIQRQTSITEDTNRLLTGVLGTMREAVVIVDSQMRVALFNDAASAIFRLLSGDAGLRGTLSRTGKASDSTAQQQRASILASSGAGATTGKYRLTDITRDPAINNAFGRVLADRTRVELRVEM